VIGEYQLSEGVLAAHVERIRLPPLGAGPTELALSDGTTMTASRLVIATGSGTPQMPSWVEQIAGTPPPEALQHSDRIHLPSLQPRKGQRILIVGGGLTSAHLALGALRRGALVQLLCRRGLKQKPFDADPGWLGPKYLKAFHAEPCLRRRRRLVLEARDGGSITPQAAADLRQAEQRGELQLHEHCEVKAARWSSGQWDLVCRGGQHLCADRIWLATGHRQGVSQHPLLQQLVEQHPIELVDDWLTDLHPRRSLARKWHGMTVLELEMCWEGDGNVTHLTPEVGGGPVRTARLTLHLILPFMPLSETEQLQIVPPPDPHKDALVRRRA
jgi:glycine/D-amino acid oxidase-like deaminating enzyme